MLGSSHEPTCSSYSWYIWFHKPLLPHGYHWIWYQYHDHDSKMRHVVFNLGLGLGQRWRWIKWLVVLATVWLIVQCRFQRLRFWVWTWVWERGIRPLRMRELGGCSLLLCFNLGHLKKLQIWKFCRFEQKESLVGQWLLGYLLRKVWFEQTHPRWF